MPSVNLPIVSQSADGALTTTSLIVAEGVETQHASVIRLVRDNRSDFEEFGGVGFEIQPFETAGGRQERTVAVLNRDQAMLLMTYMRNSPVVREFKKNLVRAFSEMEKKLAAPAVPQTYAEALRAAAEQAERAEVEAARARALEVQAKVDKPKALFADAVATSDTAILIGDLAKILRGNGIEVGANRLFRWMRAEGFLISRKGTDWNMPTQRAMELELFRIKETSVTHSDGHVTVSRTPKVTGKGQTYFVSRFMDGRFTV